MKKEGVDTIELGIQSFDEEVLLASKRGHTRAESIKAIELIKEFGFKLGIQLMIGLPKDTKEKSINSAKEAATFNPEYSRIYPTLVLKETELAKMYMNGEFSTPTEEEILKTAVEMYKILESCGSYILRVGLKSTDNIKGEADLTGGYHPAFRQLVEGEIAKEVIEKAITENTNNDEGNLQLLCESSSKSFNNMIGHKGINKKYFTNTYPHVKISYMENSKLRDGEYSIRVK